MKAIRGEQSGAGTGGRTPRPCLVGPVAIAAPSVPDSARVEDANALPPWESDTVNPEILTPEFVTDRPGAPRKGQRRARSASSKARMDQVAAALDQVALAATVGLPVDSPVTIPDEIIDSTGNEIGTVVNPAGAGLGSRALMLACRGVVGPVLRMWPITPLTIPLARTAFDTLARLRPGPNGVEMRQIRLDHFRMEIVRPRKPTPATRAGLDPNGIVMYLHGGGFIGCGLETHRPVVAALARRTGLPVVSVEYRQLPQTRISGSVQDCLTAYRWLLQHGADPNGSGPAGRIVFAGDSAGGYLAFSTALRAIATGLPAPAGLVGLSPLLDLDYTAKRSYRNVTREAYIPLSGLARVVRYGAEIGGRLDPSLSPVNGSLAGLPPVLLVVGEDELLRYDCELMARRLSAAGVPNVLELWRGQVHAFTSILPDLPESRAALDRVARFVRDCMTFEQQTRTA